MFAERGGHLSMAVPTACFVLALTALSPAAAKHGPSAGDRVLGAINEARLEAGESVLEIDPHLSSLARRYSRKVANKGGLRPKGVGKDLGDDPEFEYAIEAASARSIRAMTRKLLQTERSRETLLVSTWDAAGVGVATKDNGTQVGTVYLRGPKKPKPDHGAQPQPAPSPDPSPTPDPSPSPTPSPSPSPNPTPPPDPPGVKIPSTIPSDCSVDVTQQITDWIASVPDGSTLVFQWRGCYRTERTILVRDRMGLTLEGNEAVFKRFELSPPELQYPNANAHWRFVGGGDITLRQMRVEGTNTVPDQREGFGSYKLEFEFEHAFAFHGVQGVDVESSSADAIWGDGLYFAGTDQHSGQPTRNVRVSGFTVDRNGRQGVALSSVDGALLENVQILHSRRSAFDLEPPPGTVRNVEIRYSYTNSIGLAFASSGRGDVSYIDIHANRIDGPSVPWIYVKDSLGGRRHDWQVHDNVVLTTLGSPMAMLYFVNVDNVSVARNISHAATTQSRKAVEFWGAGGSLAVVDNDFTGACAPYVKDVATGEVLSSGNIVSVCV